MEHAQGQTNNWKAHNLDIGNIYEIDYCDERMLVEVVDHHRDCLVIKVGKPLRPRTYDILSTLAFVVRHPVYIGTAKKFLGITYGIQKHTSI